MEGTCKHLFYEASITLTLQPDKDTTVTTKPISTKANKL